MEQIDLTPVWKDWIKAELYSGCTRGGFSGYSSANACIKSLLQDEEPTKQEWEDGYNLLLYKYRGIYLIENILNDTVPVKYLLKIQLTRSQVAVTNDWAGRSITVSMDRSEHSVEKDTFHYDRIDYKGPAIPCIAISTSADPRGMIVIEGNHRCRAFIREERNNESILEFWVLIVPMGKLSEACNHV